MNEKDGYMKHILYETKDRDKPDSICDGNGEVVLDLCRVCRGGECSLATNCPGRSLTPQEADLICNGKLDF